MAEGTTTYDGLAVPLYGEAEIQAQSTTLDVLTLTGASGSTGDFLICQDSSGTELVQIQDDGRVRITRRGTFSEAINAWYYCTVDTGAVQEYAGAFLLDEEATDTTGGRRAVLNLRFNANTAGNNAAKSFINFNDEGEVGTSLFTVLAGASDGGGCYETLSDPAITKGFVIYANNEKLWLLCSSAST